MSFLDEFGDSGKKGAKTETITIDMRHPHGEGYPWGDLFPKKGEIYTRLESLDDVLTYLVICFDVGD